MTGASTGDASSQDLPDPAAQSVALDRTTEVPAGRDAKAIMVEPIRYQADDHESIRPGASSLADAREVRPGPESRHGPPLGLPAVRR